MTHHRRITQKGQTVLLFALLFPVLLGVMALSVEAGWGYFVQKRAQTAADAAAVAAVSAASDLVASGQAMTCSSLGCQAASSCPSAGNLENGCQYAAVNGFTPGGYNQQQTVTIAAGAAGNPPGVPGVPVAYWVQVTTQHSLPQMFSGLFSGKGLAPSAIATAALRKTPVTASLDLLNRNSDCFVSVLNIGLVCGEDLLTLGSNNLTASNGIYMSSSNPTGTALPQVSAATLIGLSTVQAPSTYVMGKGGYSLLGAAQWTAAPVNGLPDGDNFTDPLAGKGQPPAPSGLVNYPISGGVITGSILASNPKLLPPGNYYATIPVLGTPSGTPLVILGNVKFSDGQALPCGGFCNYVFFGGLTTGALSNVVFSPGRYVFAGAQPIAGGPGAGLTVGANASLTDLTPLVGGAAQQNSDAGEIFIFTDSNYSGLTIPTGGLSFPQVQAGIFAGVNPTITLHGLNAQNVNLPPELQTFAPVLIWQDQANTTLKYQSNGKLDVSCSGVCANVLSVPGSQQMIISASQKGGAAGTNLYGTIYGPRGSWLTILGVLPGDAVAGPLQIITGALQMTLNSNLSLQPLASNMTRVTTALIQ